MHLLYGVYEDILVIVFLGHFLFTKHVLLIYKFLFSETSVDMARQTFEDALNLDTDCAIVCVFSAQFEIRQNKKDEATSILRSGKMDGRLPKFLIKNAYRNLRENKPNLFEGISDPWDDSLHDITATATIQNNPHKSPVNMKRMLFSIKSIFLAFVSCSYLFELSFT